MRKFIVFAILAILALLPFSCFAQMSKYAFTESKFEDNSYTKVFNDSNISKKEMYQNVKRWVSKSFGSYKAVIQYEDAENTSLTLKGIIPIEITDVDAANYTVYNVGLDFTLSIDCRDNKYRLKFENLSVKGTRSVSLGLAKSIKHIDLPLSEFLALSKNRVFGLHVSPAFADLINSASKAISTKDDF